jgi:uncharacterized protein YqiB (DUF1249 family)
MSQLGYSITEIKQEQELCNLATPRNEYYPRNKKHSRKRRTAMSAKVCTMRMVMRKQTRKDLPGRKVHKLQLSEMQNKIFQTNFLNNSWLDCIG